MMLFEHFDKQIDNQIESLRVATINQCTLTPCLLQALSTFFCSCLTDWPASSCSIESVWSAQSTINHCIFLTPCLLQALSTKRGKALVCESSKKAHLMIGRWSDCVKKEVPWNPSVTISHNQIIISGPRKNWGAPTSLCAECILGKCICELD